MNFFRDLVVLIQNTPHVRKQSLPCLCQPGTWLSSLDEPCLQLRLQTLDHPAEGWLGHVHLLGGSGKIHGLHQFAKPFYLSDIHLPLRLVLCKHQGYCIRFSRGGNIAALKKYRPRCARPQEKHQPANTKTAAGDGCPSSRGFDFFPKNLLYSMPSPGIS